jgi:hypothetical protein
MVTARTYSRDQTKRKIVKSLSRIKSGSSSSCMCFVQLKDFDLSKKDTLNNAKGITKRLSSRKCFISHFFIFLFIFTTILNLMFIVLVELAKVFPLIQTV